MTRAPAVGDPAHFVIDVENGTTDDGTPLYRTACRAAVITALDDNPGTTPGEVWVDLAVLHPTAIEFVQTVRQDQAPDFGGTWHWPDESAPADGHDPIEDPAVLLGSDTMEEVPGG